MRLNNFDFLRLLAALLVVVGHAYGVFEHEQAPTFLGPPISVLGLIIFFSISGYLVTRSWIADPSLIQFTRKRSLRIFPGLIMAVIITTFIIGPIWSTLPLNEYLSNSETFGYLSNIALHYTYGLPGIFGNNPLPGAVNISLWSLPVEFSLYLATPLLWVMTGRWHAAALSGVTAILALASIYLAYYNRGAHPVFYGTDLTSAVGMSFFFTAGAFFAASQIKLSVPVACLLFIAWTIEPHYFTGAARFPIAIAVAFTIPYVVLTIGSKSWPVLRSVGRFGDISYGIYLYAFPIQQVIAYHFEGKITVGESIALSLAAIIPLAIASWYLIEKRALVFRDVRLARAFPVEQSTVEH